jgi:hypothetical protein
MNDLNQFLNFSKIYAIISKQNLIYDNITTILLRIKIQNGAQIQDVLVKSFFV